MFITTAACTTSWIWIPTSSCPSIRIRVEEAIPFVKEGTNVTVKFFKGNAFSVAAPNFVELEVTDTEPGFKGDTASNTYKPATLETGYTLQVPLFINTGDHIRVTPARANI